MKQKIEELKTGKNGNNLSENEIMMKMIENQNKTIELLKQSKPIRKCLRM